MTGVPLEITGLTKIFDTPTGPVYRGEGCSREIGATASLSALSATPVVASPPCFRLSPDCRRQLSAEWRSMAKKSMNPAAIVASSFSRHRLLPWLYRRRKCLAGGRPRVS